MAKDRRDSKNRILMKGEYQKADGRYMYKYTDSLGTPRFVYSWTLTKSDRTPKGKTPGPCLRDLEMEIAKDLFDGINTHKAKHITLNEYFEKYISSKGRLKEPTRRNYTYRYNAYVRDSIGTAAIGDIRYSDVKAFYNKILNDGHSINVVRDINTIIHPVFTMAVKDDHIRKNPASGVYIEIRDELDIVKNKRKSLTVQQQEAFINYVKNHSRYRHWLPLFTFLFGTGCRISEALGLTWRDIDFENETISINHTLCYFPDEHTGKIKYKVQTPKSAAGIREIPMFKDVRKALREEYCRQMMVGFNKSVIDGYSGFIFTNKDGYAYAPKNIIAAIDRIVNSYNNAEMKAADFDERSAVLLPRFTPHVIRHTFCTRMCENESNLKVIQEVMGHGSITITMDVYADVTAESKQKSFMNLEGKFKIG